MKILIMAGGSGERFWPLSTKERPKQLLPLISDKSMIRETVNRLSGLVASKDIYVATNAIQVENLKKELPEIPEENIIIEPAFRDTAAAILYGSTYIAVRNDNPDIAVLASDHIIGNISDFQNSLRTAFDLAKKTSKIVTLGVKPTYPETGYGYIKVNNNELLYPNGDILFFEKPTLEKAQSYFKDGHYLWNSGMFIFNYNTLINEFKQHSVEHLNIISLINSYIQIYSGNILSEKVKKNFELFPKISIDFSIMEKSKNLICLPTDFGWNDIGSFLSLFNYKKSMFQTNNVVQGTTFTNIDSNNNLIISDNGSIDFFSHSINNMIIILYNNKLLIVPMNQSQNIKDLIRLLK